MSDSTRRLALSADLLSRAPLWGEADARARRLAHGHTDDATDALRLPQDYRLLAHDLARVRTLLPNARAREYLEAAYTRAHVTLHHGARRADRAAPGSTSGSKPRVTCPAARRSRPVSR